MAKRIDAAACMGYGKQMTMNGQTFKFGLQKDPKTFTRASGIVRSRRDGDVLENLNCQGVPIEISHSNVTLRNILIDQVGYHSIRQMGRATGLVVEFIFCDGGKRTNTHNGDDMVYTENPKDNGGVVCLSYIRNSLFINIPCDCLNSSGGEIMYNVLIGAGYAPGGHADAISCHAGGPLKIGYNYIDYITPPDATIPVTNAAIKLVNHWPPPHKQVEVFGNALLGGGYTIYAGSKEINFHDNFIGGGKWGGFYPGDEAKCVTSNNRPFTEMKDVVITTVDVPAGGNGDEVEEGKPVCTAQPTITGATKVSEKGHTTSGTWKDVQPSWTWAWQWAQNGTDIPGATTHEYTPTSGGDLIVKVMVTNDAGTTEVSSPVVKVAGPVVPPVEGEGTTFTDEQMKAMRDAVDVLDTTLG